MLKQLSVAKGGASSKITAPPSHRPHGFFVPRRGPSPDLGSAPLQMINRLICFDRRVVTDQAVPEGHKGLHEALYGEEGAHKATSYNFRKGEDSGEALIPTEAYLSDRDGEKPLGVYALYDAQQNIQYVSYSRNVVLSVRGHVARLGSEQCAFVRVMVFANKAMATRANMEREVERWIDECGTIPPGNGAEKGRWEATKSIDPEEMSDEERGEYEEKKLKMRKAMGEDIGGDNLEGEKEDSKQRRLNLIKAVEGDNWSEVIDRQSKDTMDGESAGGIASDSRSDGPVVSPFTQASVHRTIGNDESKGKELTAENVDLALEEVRPYLIADGGNVEVAAVENGRVFLRLQGACGTCPSSAATMKMGIERSLKATFGDVLKEVVEVDKVNTAATASSVDEHLDVLRPAITNFGGKVQCIAVEQGTAVVKYAGPPSIGKGVVAAIRDKFPDIKEVILVDF